LADSGNAIDVALAAGNPLMLSALSEVIERDGRFSLVFTAGTAEGFLQTVGRVPVAVAILDWTLPLLGGERLIAVLREMPGAPRVVAYAVGGDNDVPRRAMAAGAAGLGLHNEPPERLLDTAAAVAAGRMVFPYLDVRALNQDPLRSLTHRERALLQSLAQGMSNKELAEAQGISVNTVKFHLRNLFDKLGVRSRGQAIALFYSERDGRSRTSGMEGRLSNEAS